MPIQFREMPYAEFLGHVETIATQVEADAWQPHFLVGIGRGGLVPGTYLSHRLSIPLLSIDHSSKVHVFSDALLVHLAACARAGERYLFVDDINDSGKTLVQFRELLRESGADLANIRIAVLIHNAASQAEVDYAAEQIDRRVDKFWFTFPWGAVAPQAAREADAREDPARLGLDADDAETS